MEKPLLVTWYCHKPAISKTEFKVHLMHETKRYRTQSNRECKHKKAALSSRNSSSALYSPLLTTAFLGYE
jgi:hypothetical protein